MFDLDLIISNDTCKNLGEPTNTADYQSYMEQASSGESITTVQLNTRLEGGVEEEVSVADGRVHHQRLDNGGINDDSSLLQQVRQSLSRVYGNLVRSTWGGNGAAPPASILTRIRGVAVAAEEDDNGELEGREEWRHRNAQNEAAVPIKKPRSKFSRRWRQLRRLLSRRGYDGKRVRERERKGMRAI